MNKLLVSLFLGLSLSSCSVNEAIDNAMTSGTDYTIIPKQRLCYIVVEQNPIYYEYSAASRELNRRGENCDDYVSSTVKVKVN